MVGGLRLSPDGQYIATPSIDAATNSRVLLLIPVAGGEPRVLMSVFSGVKTEDLSKIFAQGEAIGIFGVGSGQPLAAGYERIQKSTNSGGFPSGEASLASWTSRHLKDGL